LLFHDLLQDPENFNLIICRGVIDRAAAILLEKLEKHVTPGVIQEGKDFLSQRLEFVDADRLNGLLNRFAARILSMSRFSDSITSRV
jgi:hypothetical protein